MRGGQRVWRSRGLLGRGRDRLPRALRPAGIGMAAVALAILALGFDGTTAATAGVCTGGAPDEASGSPEARVNGLVPFLVSPRWSQEQLPSWEAERTSTSWGDQLAYAWYRY